jgi:hypothetical protein
VAYPVLECMEEKQNFTKVEGSNVDFFLCFIVDEINIF